MALNVQMIKYYNQMIGEDIIVPRLVNQQTLNFNQLCEYLADGSGSADNGSGTTTPPPAGGGD